MDRSQSLNAPLYFDSSNYAFWKVWMKAFLCSIDETVWDAVDMGWTRSEAATDEFHRISYVTIAKETTYEGTKKVKDAKL